MASKDIPPSLVQALFSDWFDNGVCFLVRPIDVTFLCDIDSASVGEYRSLFMAVLVQGVCDYLKYIVFTRKGVPKHKSYYWLEEAQWAVDAEAWVAGMDGSFLKSDEDLIMSFDSVCKIVGYDPEDARHILQNTTFNEAEKLLKVFKAKSAECQSTLI